MACGMRVVIKNTFLQVEKGSSISRRCQSVPREWKPIETCPHGYCSDVSTDASPRSHASSDHSFEESLIESSNAFAPNKHCINSATPSELARSIAAVGGKTSSKAQRKQQDASATASFICHSCPPRSKAAIDLRGQISSCDSSKAVHVNLMTSAIHAGLTSRLPAQCVGIEQVVTEESTKGLVSAEVPTGTFGVAQYYDVMQQARQALVDVVSRSSDLILLSARVQKEDYGYSLRSSVACVPSNVHDKVCWEIVRHGSCPRNKCCRWWHPEAADLIKLRIVIRRQNAKCVNK